MMKGSDIYLYMFFPAEPGIRYHERKTIMYNNASMFIALPGGIGTLEELMEVLTWKQLGLIKEKVLIVILENKYNACT